MNHQENHETGQIVAEIAINRTLWITFACLFSIEILLFVLDYFINWHEGASRQGVRDMFSTTEEHSIAGWFAATQTFVVAMAAWAVVILNRYGAASAWRRFGWIVIAILFTYLSVDDGAAIHEHLGGGLKETPVIGDAIDAWSRYSWHVVILPFFAALGVFMLFFLWQELSHRNEKLGILAAFSFFAIAIGQDYVEGTIEEYDWFEAEYGLDSSAILHFAKSLEESLEMLGMTVFLIVFLSHLMRTYRTITLRFIQKSPG